MNLLLVFSDTHGQIHTANDIILSFPQTTHVLHLGDMVSDAVRLSHLHPNLLFEYVLGNCDSKQAEHIPYDKRLVIGGQQILLTHGHRYSVKDGLLRLSETARLHADRLVLFGHTHMPFQLEENGIILLNPGSISLPKQTGKPTFGLIEIGHGRIEARIMEVP